MAARGQETGLQGARTLQVTGTSLGPTSVREGGADALARRPCCTAAGGRPSPTWASQRGCCRFPQPVKKLSRSARRLLHHPPPCTLHPAPSTLGSCSRPGDALPLCERSAAGSPGPPAARVRARPHRARAPSPTDGGRHTQGHVVRGTHFKSRVFF